MPIKSKICQNFCREAFVVYSILPTFVVSQYLTDILGVRYRHIGDFFFFYLEKHHVGDFVLNSS